MNKKTKEEVRKILKEDIWFNLCVLQRDYGVTFDGYMIEIIKFIIQCIADKYKIDLGLKKD